VQLPGAVELALFSYWAFAILHKFFQANPVDFTRSRDAFLPILPPESFARANLWELARRVAAGHAIVAVWAAAVLGLGAATLGFLCLRGRTGRPDRFLLSAGLGLAWGMLLWLGLGLAGLWFPVLAWAAAAGGAVMLVASRPALLRRGGKEAVTDRPGFAAKLLVWLLAAEAALALLMLAASSMAPERFYDAMVYHLACPSLFAMHHRVVGLPNLMHASFPQGMPMHYGWQMLMGGEPAPRAWRLWVALLVCGTVWRMGSREGRPLAGLAAASLVATAPLFFLNGTQTSVDIEVCLFVLLACLAARESTRGAGAGKWMVVAAIFTGAAFSVKFTAVFWAPWLALLCALPSGSRRPGLPGLLPSWKKLAVFSFVASLWLVPWFARNEVVVGNPFYPYLTGVFRGGRQWDPPRHARFLEQQSGYVVEKASQLAKLPWLLVNGHTSENYVGPALVVLAPLFILHPPAGAAVRTLGAVTGLSLALWVCITHTHRFVLATWVLAWLLAVWMLWEIAVKRPRWRDALLLLLVVLSGVGVADLAIFWGRNTAPVDMLAGREGSRGFLARKTINDYTGMALGAGGLLPARARVMVVGETRGLWWPRPFFSHSAYDVQAFEEVIYSSRDAGEAVKRLRQLGVTHLYVNDPETSRMKFRYSYPMLVFNARQMGVIAELWRDRLDETARTPRNALFAVRWGGKASGGPGPAQPLSFDDDALRTEYEGWSTVTFMGGSIAVEKKVVR